jgi:hypothetical protein
MTRRRARLLAAGIVAVPLVGYPLVVAADGVPFPSPVDCVRLAPSGSTDALDLVFGRRDTVSKADQLLDQVKGVGYVDAEIQADGCGRWKVLYDGITSYAQGVSSRDEARGAGLDAELEIEPPA